MHRVHQDQKAREELMLDLDEIARAGARRMLAEALEAEVEAYLEAAKEERDEYGRALVVSNGYAREREVPLLYLHGLSSGDFVLALQQFFGTEAGLSAATITRLTERWRAELESFMRRDLSRRDYVYVWVDGIHTGVRLGQDERLCSLVMVGARLD